MLVDSVFLCVLLRPEEDNAAYWVEVVYRSLHRLAILCLMTHPRPSGEGMHPHKPRFWQRVFLNKEFLLMTELNNGGGLVDAMQKSSIKAICPTTNNALL
jgi:hypothetical protein